MSHREMRRSIDALLDGELTSPEDVAQIRAHLERCPTCRCDAEMIHLVKLSLRRLADRRPTDLTTARLRRWVNRLSP